MINKYLDDYYTNGITARRIAELEGVSEHRVGDMFREQGILTVNQLINKLEFEDKELKRTLRVKYTNIANRCRGKGDYKDSAYNGLSYLPLPNYIQFCNDNKDTAMEIWEGYIDSGKSLKFALTLDRINPREGYNISNIRFVTHGYNSYRANINPCEVIYKDEKYYFMSAEEGSRFFGVRKKDIGDNIRKIKYRNRDFSAKTVDMDVVLRENGVANLQEYYNKFINID